MNNSSFVFKFLTIAYLIVDFLLALFFLISFVLVFAKVMVLGNLHFILLIITIGINLIYLVYLALVLIINRRRKII